MSTKNEKAEFFNYGKKINTDTKFSHAFFSSESSIFNYELVKFCALLTVAGYDLPWARNPEEKCSIYKTLKSMGAENIVFYTNTGAAEVDFTMASIKFEANDRENRLIIICPVGSHHGQWYDNFDCGTGDIHKGYLVCENFVYSNLESYIDSFCRDGLPLKFLITGHSRGGAVAALLAKHLIDEEKYAKAADVYAFSFASPAYSKAKDICSEKYAGINNIINDEDFVVKCMPRKWGYGRYGNTFSLPNCKNCDDFSEVLTKVNSFYSHCTCGKIYTPFKNGPDTPDALVNEMCRNINSVEEYYNKKFRFFGSDISLKEFFFRTVCAVTAEISNPEKYKEGVKLLLKTFLLRYSSSSVFKSAAGFFVINEGLGGITGNKIFKTHFSAAHEMSTYCSFVMSSEESQLRRQD